MRTPDYDCVSLRNKYLKISVTQSVGPRIISLRFKDGENIFAELPNSATERPDGRKFRFYGGHRLWHAPEHAFRTYAPDDQPVEIVRSENSLSAIQQLEEQTGIDKSIRITLVPNKPQAVIHHTLTNRGLWAIECAPWAITQFKTGGIAILPQPQESNNLRPNRSLALWSYTDIANPNVMWGNRYILVRAEMQSPFKIGFPNPRGWLAYWLNGVLFVKRSAYNPHATYYDLGSSSECYCNDQSLQLETLAPIGKLESEASVSYVETWELHTDVERPADEDAAQRIADTLGLE